MRYALISDLHANRQAWTAVDKDISNHGADSILCLGDIVGYGPDPVAVLDAVYERSAATVIGNHDAVVAGSLDRELFNDNARRLIDWTCDQLGDEAAEYFAGLPYKMSDDNLLCVHAEAASPASFGYVIDVVKAYESFQAVSEQVIFAGHTHVPGVFVQSPTGAVAWQGPGDFKIVPDHRYFINVGSVGDPRDNSPRASYCLYDVEAGEVMFRRVPFDYAGYRTAIEKATLKTKPHCLSLLEKGASVAPPQPLRDMAIKPKTGGPTLKVKAAEKSVDLKAAQQKKKRRGKRKFGGVKRKRGGTSSTKLGAVSNSKLRAVTPPDPKQAETAQHAPPVNKKLSVNAITWIVVAAIVACIAIGGVLIFNQLPAGQNQNTAVMPAPPAQSPAPSAIEPDSQTVETISTAVKNAASTPAPKVPTAIGANEAAVLKAMNDHVEAQKRIIKIDKTWSFRAKNLAGENAESLKVSGPYKIQGSPERRWLRSEGSTIDVPLVEGADAPTITLKFWIKLDNPLPGLIASIGGTRLGISDGVLVLKSNASSPTTAVSAETLKNWTHLVLTKNHPNTGQYQSAVRLFVNGKRVAEIPDKELAATPIAPIQFAKLSGSLAGIRVLPKHWITPTISQDHKNGQKTLQTTVQKATPKPQPGNAKPPPSAATQLSNNFVWTMGKQQLLAATDKPLIIEGRSTAVGAPDNLKFISFRGGSAKINLGENVQADRFNLEFWYRPNQIADQGLVAFGKNQLVISKGKLGVLIDKKAKVFDKLKLTRGKWHHIVVSKVIKNSKHVLVVGLNHEKPIIVEHSLAQKAVGMHPLSLIRLNGDLGPVRLLNGGYYGVTADAHARWRALRKNLEAPTVEPDNPYHWPLGNKTTPTFLDERSGGAKLSASRAIKAYKDPERGTVAVVSGTKTAPAVLQLPKTPANATGGSVSFWIKPAAGSGTILQIAGGKEPLSLGVDAAGLLKLVAGTKSNGETAIKRNKWQHLVITWRLNVIVVKLDDTIVCRNYALQQNTGNRIIAIGSPRGIALPALIDDIRLFPYLALPAPIPAESAAEGVLAKIPEITQYQLVYDFDLAKAAKEIKYDIDNTAKIKAPFDRIAYLLELETDTAKQYAYASMNAFTEDVKKIGIPYAGSKIKFQQKVANLNVYSNVKGVVTGTQLTDGNIEFWALGYGQQSKLSLPNASNALYDFDDTPADTQEYGSMQIHNHEAKQTILAINNWKSGPKGDLGIGNSDGTKSLDWTFSKNAGSFKSKRLRIFVRLKK